MAVSGLVVSADRVVGSVVALVVSEVERVVVEVLVVDGRRVRKVLARYYIKMEVK